MLTDTLIGRVSSIFIPGCLLAAFSMMRNREITLLSIFIKN